MNPIFLFWIPIGLFYISRALRSRFGAQSTVSIPKQRRRSPNGTIISSRVVSSSSGLNSNVLQVPERETGPVDHTIEPGTAITVASRRSVPHLEDRSTLDTRDYIVTKSDDSNAGATQDQQQQRLVLEQIRTERLALLKNVKNLAAEQGAGSDADVGHSRSLFEPSTCVEPDQVQSEPESCKEVEMEVRPEDLILITRQQEQQESCSSDSVDGSDPVNEPIEIAFQKTGSDLVKKHKQDEAVLQASGHESTSEDEAKSDLVEQQGQTISPGQPGVEQGVQSGHRLASEQSRSDEIEQEMFSDDTNEQANDQQKDGLPLVAVEQGASAGNDSQGNCPSSDETVRRVDTSEQLRPDDCQQGGRLTSNDIHQVDQEVLDDTNEQLRLDGSEQGDQLTSDDQGYFLFLDKFDQRVKMDDDTNEQLGADDSCQGIQSDKVEQSEVDQSDEIEQGDQLRTDEIDQCNKVTLDQSNDVDQFQTNEDEVDQISECEADQSDKVEQGNQFQTDHSNMGCEFDQSDEVEQGDQLQTDAIDQSNQVVLDQSSEVEQCDQFQTNDEVDQISECEADQSDKVEQGDQFQSGHSSKDKEQCEVDQSDEVEQTDEVDQSNQVEVDQSNEVEQCNQFQANEDAVDQIDECEADESDKVVQYDQLQTDKVEHGCHLQTKEGVRENEIEQALSDRVKDHLESNEIEQGVEAKQGTNQPGSNEVQLGAETGQRGEVQLGSVQEEQLELGGENHQEVDGHRIESGGVEKQMRSIDGLETDSEETKQIRADAVEQEERSRSVEQDAIDQSSDEAGLRSQLRSTDDENNYTTTVSSAPQCHVLPMRRTHFSDLEPVFFSEQNPQLPIGHRPVKPEDSSQFQQQASAIGENRQPVPWAPPASSSTYAACPTEQSEPMYNVMWNGPTGGLPPHPCPPPPPQQEQDGQCLDQSGENAYYQSYYTLFVPTPYYTYTVIPK